MIKIKIKFRKTLLEIVYKCKCVELLVVKEFDEYF